MRILHTSGICYMGKVYMKKRLAAILLALAVIFAAAPAESSFAATDNTIESAAVYHTDAGDYQSGDCILTATKCMIRRALILRGSKAWANVTNKTLRSPATLLGLLLNTFTFEADGLSFKITCGYFSGNGDAARIKEIETLIKQHPEGIVVWGNNASKNGIHGVLVTSVKNGVVYAADSLHNTGNTSKGIQKWSDTSMKAVSNVTKYWYIKEVGLAKNAPAPKNGQAIKPISADNANYASALAISDPSIPTTLTQGKSFNVKGTITSNYKIKKVTVGVYNSSGKAITSKTVSPNAWSYNLSKIDSYIKFGTVPVGTFTYKISATDEKTTSVLVNAAYKVQGKSTLKISSYNKPKKIKKGKSFSIKGKISSNNKIKSVTVKITDSSGSAKCSARAKPNAKSYNIKKLDAKIKFGKLKKGTYYYVVEATDTVKSKTLVNKKFTIY